MYCLAFKVLVAKLLASLKRSNNEHNQLIIKPF
jgi:hypothetical protein